jgi:hypothetical protein
MNVNFMQVAHETAIAIDVGAECGGEFAFDGSTMCHREVATF